MDKIVLYKLVKNIYKSENIFNRSVTDFRLMIFNQKMKSLFTKYGDVNQRMKNIEEIFNQINMYLGVSEVEKKQNGEVFTPFELINEILDTLPIEVWGNPNLKWFDPANGVGNFPAVIIQRLMLGLKEWEPDDKKRYKHILEKMIYTCDISSKNMFLYLNIFDPNNEYNMNYFKGSFLTKEFDEYLKNVWGINRFDNIIGNPPFNQMIDLLFLQKSHKISDKILFVHPSTWLLDEKGTQNKFIETKNLVKYHLESIKFFNGNKIFGIQLFVPCVITYIDKNKKTTNIKCVDKINDVEMIYDSIHHINKYSDKEIYLSLKQKISLIIKDNNLYNRLRNQLDLKYFINLSQIRGHVDLNSEKSMLKDDFYTLCTKDLKSSLEKRKQRELTQFSFETEKESNNFLNFVKTNFVRFCLSILKNNQNLYCGEMRMIPWLDFTKEWTDEKLYKHFGISEEEINFIEKNIPKYY